MHQSNQYVIEMAFVQYVTRIHHNGCTKKNCMHSYHVSGAINYVWCFPPSPKTHRQHPQNPQGRTLNLLCIKVVISK